MVQSFRKKGWEVALMSQGVAVLPAPKIGDVIYVPYIGFYAWHDGAQQISGGQAKVEDIWVETSGYLNVGHMVKVEGHPIPYHWENDLARIQEGLKREYGDRRSTSYDWEH